MFCTFKVLAVGYVFTALLAFYFGSLYLRLSSVFLGLFLFCFILYKAFDRNFFCYLIIVLVLFVFSTFNIFWSEGRSFFVILSLIANVGLSWFVFYFNLTRFFYEYVFYFILFLTTFLFLFFDFGAQDFNIFLEGSSRNVYSAIFLASAVGYTISRKYRGLRPSLFLLAVFFLVNFPLYGRSGIFFSFLLFFIVFSLDFPRTFLLFVVAIILSFSAIGLLSDFDFINIVLESTNFSRGIESARFAMLEEYMSNLSGYSLLLGGDFTCLPLINEYGGNPHNAYLRLHAYWGVGLIAVFMLIFASLVYAVIDKQLLFASMSVLILARAFFDIVYFVNIIDFLFIPIIFYALFRPFFIRSFNKSSNVY